MPDAQCPTPNPHPRPSSNQVTPPYPTHPAHAAHQGRFRIVVMTERPLAAPPTPIEPLRDLRLRGEWREGNAGGCRNHVSWRQNEQYMLRLNRARRVSVVLERPDPLTQGSEVALHSTRTRTRTRTRTLTLALTRTRSPSTRSERRPSRPRARRGATVRPSCCRASSSRARMWPAPSHLTPSPSP